MASLGAMLGSKGKSLPMGDDEEEGDYEEPMGGDEAPEDAGGVPPDFQAAYDEYMKTPSAQGMYDMIEACKGGSPSGSPGLLAIIGGKGKKP